MTIEELVQMLNMHYWNICKTIQTNPNKSAMIRKILTHKILIRLKRLMINLQLCQDLHLLKLRAHVTVVVGEDTFLADVQNKANKNQKVLRTKYGACSANLESGYS